MFLLEITVYLISFNIIFILIFKFIGLFILILYFNFSIIISRSNNESV